MIYDQILTPKEVSQIGKIFGNYISEKTCSALSTLISEPVNHKIENFSEQYSDINKIKPFQTSNFCTVRLNGKGDINIEILYSFELDHAEKIASKLLCQNEDYHLDEMGASALQEVANIMTGSFFNAIAQETGFRVELSTPNYHKGNLISQIRESVNDCVEKNIVPVITEVSLFGQQTGTRIHMFIIHDSEQARKIITNDSDNLKGDSFNDISSNEDTNPTDLKNSSKVQGDYFIGGDNPELDSLIEEFTQ